MAIKLPTWVFHHTLKNNFIMMNRILLFASLFFLMCFPKIFSQPAANTEIYLITCGPGTETYSIYGHSALRIVMPGEKIDRVYNWGLFDFDTPHFAWNFAKGRLNYMVGGTSMNSFMREYLSEKRYVISQKVNLTPEEIARLISLINENLKPENISYKYDFFYDNCSTRIRDLLEKAVGNKLIYPPSEAGKDPTFRNLINKYQQNFSWLNFGVDILIGAPADKKALFRDRMFLPVEMQKGLSEALVNRDNKMTPLLQSPELLLDYETPVLRSNLFNSPSMAFTLFFIVVVLLTSSSKRKKLVNIVDITVFSIFSILAVMMIFFNFFADHQQTKMNLNIIWLNPLLIICLIMLILKKAGTIWFRMVFFITAAFLAIMYFLPQGFNLASIPLILIVLVRSSARGSFSWNPLSLEQGEITH